jgi:hypothetical protein
MERNLISNYHQKVSQNHNANWSVGPLDVKAAEHLEGGYWVDMQGWTLEGRRKEIEEKNKEKRRD